MSVVSKFTSLEILTALPRCYVLGYNNGAKLIDVSQMPHLREIVMHNVKQVRRLSPAPFPDNINDDNIDDIDAEFRLAYDDAGLCDFLMSRSGVLQRGDIHTLQLVRPVYGFPVCIWKSSKLQARRLLASLAELDVKHQSAVNQLINRKVWIDRSPLALHKLLLVHKTGGVSAVEIWLRQQTREDAIEVMARMLLYSRPPSECMLLVCRLAREFDGVPEMMNRLRELSLRSWRGANPFDASIYRKDEELIDALIENKFPLDGFPGEFGRNASLSFTVLEARQDCDEDEELALMRIVGTQQDPLTVLIVDFLE
jgi:hypothetical protein